MHMTAELQTVSISKEENAGKELKLSKAISLSLYYPFRSKHSHLQILVSHFNIRGAFVGLESICNVIT